MHAQNFLTILGVKDNIIDKTYMIILNSWDVPYQQNPRSQKGLMGLTS